MKSKILCSMLAIMCLLTCGLCLTSCKNRDVWTPPKRVSLSLTNKLHVEYINSSVKGFSSLPGYCVLVKEGNLYYVKTPTTYSSDRLEVFEKIRLNNAVEFAGPNYSQGYISARWNDYTNSWVSAANETTLTPLNSQYHANDRNNHVYSVGISFLDAGYGDVNHSYENGVANSSGHKHTSTQQPNETLMIGTNHVECVVWTYEAYFSEDNWSISKYWFDAETNVVLKQSSIYSSSSNKNLDADENVGLYATYFSKSESLESYLTSINRWPSPDFSSYH